MGGLDERSCQFTRLKKCDGKLPSGGEGGREGWKEGEEGRDGGRERNMYGDW